MMFTDLPWDLESKILSKVPATSLSQLRFTCKRWYALFKDPRFVGKAATQVILQKDFSVYSVSINPHGINNSFEFTGKLKSLKDSKPVNTTEIFHCDGLLLLTNKENEPVVWNPCTGQSRWIQPRNGSAMPYHKYVLGCNKFCDSYKILKISCYLAAPELYEFNSGSWRVLDVATPCIESTGLNLKGNTYWLASNVQDAANFILRFDFTRERFERLSLPFDSYLVLKIVVLSVVREEKLALLHQNNYSLEMKIWITNTKIDEAKDLSWSNFLVVDFRKFMMTTNITEVMSFLVDEENKMVVCCGKDADKTTKIYIVGENIHKQVYKDSTKGSFSIRPRLVSYVPSLVQIQQRKSNIGGKRKR